MTQLILTFAMVCAGLTALAETNEERIIPTSCNSTGGASSFKNPGPGVLFYCFGNAKSLPKGAFALVFEKSHGVWDYSEGGTSFKFKLNNQKREGFPVGLSELQEQTRQALDT